MKLLQNEDAVTGEAREDKDQGGGGERGAGK
jgi:hypothetical protein